MPSYTPTFYDKHTGAIWISIVAIFAIGTGYFTGKKFGTGWGIGAGIGVIALAFIIVLIMISNSKCFLGDC